MVARFCFVVAVEVSARVAADNSAYLDAWSDMTVLWNVAWRWQNVLVLRVDHLLLTLRRFACLKAPGQLVVGC